MISLLSSHNPGFDRFAPKNIEAPACAKNDVGPTQDPRTCHQKRFLWNVAQEVPGHASPQFHVGKQALMTETMQSTAETNCTFERPGFIQLILADEVFHNGALHVPCFVPLSSKPQDKLRLASHWVIRAARPNVGIESQPRSEDASA